METGKTFQSSLVPAGSVSAASVHLGLFLSQCTGGTSDLGMEHRCLCSRRGDFGKQILYITSSPPPYFLPSTNNK